MSVLGKPVVRAAVYTRKSSDEGLDQEFNSLDAQHEACSAYIASQRHEGWKLIKKRFDDGGISGGTLERPALSAVQPRNYVPFFNRVSGAGGFMFRAW
jgi:site-specific DNA recombinase